MEIFRLVIQPKDLSSNLELMKIYLIALMLVLINSFKLSAQQDMSKYKLTTSFGYGVENNWGNTGFYVGLAVEKEIKKWIVEVGVDYFTTNIYNSYKDNPTFYLNEERKYNTIFLNTNIQYVIGSENSLFNTKIKIGPALKFYKIKTLLSAQVYVFSNNSSGLFPIVPGTEKYYEKKGVNVSLYNGFSCDTKINSNLRIGVFLDIYSNQILIEHFIPGLNATFKL